MKIAIQAFLLSALCPIAVAQTTNPRAAQSEAIRLYPDLAKTGSLLNKEFLKAVEFAKQSSDPVLSRQDWPLLIARRVALANSVEGSTIAATLGNPRFLITRSRTDSSAFVHEMYRARVIVPYAYDGALLNVTYEGGGGALPAFPKHELSTMKSEIAEVKRLVTGTTEQKNEAQVRFGAIINVFASIVPSWWKRSSEGWRPLDYEADPLFVRDIASLAERPYKSYREANKGLKGGLLHGVERVSDFVNLYTVPNCMYEIELPHAITNGKQGIELRLEAEDGRLLDQAVLPKDEFTLKKGAAR